MKEVEKNLYIGMIGEAGNILSQQDLWCLVNVAKTLHYTLHGWSYTGRYTTSPYYVLHKEKHFISVNWVDSNRADLFNYQNKGVNVVKEVLTFIQDSLKEGKKVLITCDQGQSRSPSIALLYLAKILHIIPNQSFTEAKIEFFKIYPLYQPAEGISIFLKDHWDEF